MRENYLLENERLGIKLVVCAWRSFGKRFGEAGLISEYCSLATQRTELEAGSCHPHAAAAPAAELVDVTHVLCYRSVGSDRVSELLQCPSTNLPIGSSMRPILSGSCKRSGCGVERIEHTPVTDPQSESVNRSQHGQTAARSKGVRSWSSDFADHRPLRIA